MIDDPAASPRIRRVAVVVNPTRTDVADDLLGALAADAPDMEVEVVRADAPEEMAELIRRAVADGPTIVAAVGGDGTQRTAATVLQGSEHVLAVVPGGTVNLLGRVLGITSAADSVRAITGGAVRTMDLGTVGDDPFVLTAGTGFDAAVMHRVDDGAKRFGRAGYVVAGYRALREDRPRTVEVIVDGTRFFKGRATSVVVANIGQRASAAFKLVPDAEPDDGLIDVIVQRCDTVVSIARTVVALARARHPREDDAVFGQGSAIEVTWSGAVWSQRDGDAVREGRRFRYGVLPGALRVAVPPGGGPAMAAEAPEGAAT